MKRRHVVSAFGIMLFTACSLFAQEKPGTIAALEFQIIDRIDGSVQKETSAIVKFRPDLSYLPGK